MCEASMTHWTCAWCNYRFDSKREDIICHFAKGDSGIGIFGGCGRIKGVDKSVYDLFCPRCPPKNFGKVLHRKYETEYSKFFADTLLKIALSQQYWKLSKGDHAIYILTNFSFLEEAVITSTTT
ncbi:hypothetical protein ACHAP7_001445 [Fusarium lateritium]